MFIQTRNAENELLYLNYDNIVAFNDTSRMIYLSSGASFTLAEKESQALFNKMCRDGRILGLGAAARS